MDIAMLRQLLESGSFAGRLIVLNGWVSVIYREKMRNPV